MKKVALTEDDVKRLNKELESLAVRLGYEVGEIKFQYMGAVVIGKFMFAKTEDQNEKCAD